MDIRFSIDQEVLFEKNGISYTFIITEIRIDESGIYYTGCDDIGSVGEYKQKDLKTP